MRKILFVATNNAGVNFYRMYSWVLAARRQRTIEMAILGWDKHEKGAARWQVDIADTMNQPKLFGLLHSGGIQADAIVFGRVETPWALTTFYAMKDQFPGKPILAEIDDDITDVPEYNQASGVIRSGSPINNIALDQFKAADGLIVSTPYLKEVYSEWNQNCWVVPNSLDCARWDRAQRSKRPGLRIGWMGGTSHAEDLLLLEKVIPAIVEKNRDVQFVMVSMDVPPVFKTMKGVTFVRKWSEIMPYPDHMGRQDFDIGLAPLVDNKFNRAKSNLRWLEYSALGIPCVASKVGHFKETVRHGEDGLLAENEDAFILHLQRLIDDSKARKEMGRRAHARIYRDFNVDKNLSVYSDAIEQALTLTPKPAPSIMVGVDDMKGVVDTPGIEFSDLEVSPAEVQ